MNSKYLSGYIDGQLDDKKMIKLVKHVRNCKKCAAELLSLQKLNGEMSVFRQEKIPRVVLNMPLTLPAARFKLCARSVPVYETLAYKFGIAFFLNGFMIKFDSFSNTWVAVLGGYALLHLIIYLRRFAVARQLGIT